MKKFVLSERILGSPYYRPCIQGLCRREEVRPVEIGVRKTDPKRKIFLVLEERGLREQIPLTLFSEHPPEEELRRVAKVFG